jgi:hypothetical protein
MPSALECTCSAPNACILHLATPHVTLLLRLLPPPPPLLLLLLLLLLLRCT